MKDKSIAPSRRKRQAVELVSAKKWLRGGKDREALLEIYENLFAHIDQQMSTAA